MLTIPLCLLSLLIGWKLIEGLGLTYIEVVGRAQPNLAGAVILVAVFFCLPGMFIVRIVPVEEME